MTKAERGASVSRRLVFQSGTEDDVYKPTAGLTAREVFCFPVGRHASRIRDRLQAVDDDGNAALPFHRAFAVNQPVDKLPRSPICPRH